MNTPAMRHVNLDPIEHEGEQLFALSDPMHIVEETLVLAPAGAFIAMHLDGHHSVEAIQAKAMEQFGVEEFPIEAIDEIIRQLDEFGFMDTQAFEEIYEALVEDFRTRDTRPAFLAGKSYPEDADELRTFLDEQFTREGSVERSLAKSLGEGLPLAGLFAPHIDLHRGGHSYSHAYDALFASGKPDTVIIFGVAHMAEPVPYILTRKHFETPFGTMKTNTTIVDRLSKACTWDPFEFELCHRTEHSIEFQVLMLSYLYGPDVTIVPILTSYFGEGSVCVEGEDAQPIHRFLDECRAVVEESGGKTTVIAGVDLAHIGPCFGDDFEIDDDDIAYAEERDREDLAHVISMDTSAFFRSVMRDDNERHVCGYKAMYSAMWTLEGTATEGEMLHHDHAHDPSGGVVTFASLALR